ncbi:hypothetical protein [Rhodocyclus gracilis]|uniref:Uncharacterized protein n=1 Tax=Rhodocyclus tenuis TaxID=1066 RepID=A0A6L5K260_RHOTE|nr:hypothetical protein [Rhodocyclus gracilis]MQY52628.1 hypothetical protein [Rhodocyclus gracilis]
MNARHPPTYCAWPPRRHAHTALVWGVLFAALPGATLCAEEPLGRLFFSPVERQAIDQERQDAARRERPGDDVSHLRLDGLVSRSAGPSTLWINGSAHSAPAPATPAMTTSRRSATHTIRGGEGNTDDGARERAATFRLTATGLVHLDTGGRPHSEARIGDSVRRNSGSVAPLLDEGTLRINRPRER